MKRITDYIFASTPLRDPAEISTDDLNDLVDIVRRGLKNGFEPFGHPWAHGGRIIQPMVKYEFRLFSDPPSTFDSSGL